ncbi:MAG: hypothetical protein WD069_00935 [Planctomycetales bacterium]
MDKQHRQRIAVVLVLRYGESQCVVDASQREMASQQPVPQVVATPGIDARYEPIVPTPQQRDETGVVFGRPQHLGFVQEQVWVARGFAAAEVDQLPQRLPLLALREPGRQDIERFVARLDLCVGRQRFPSLDAESDSFAVAVAALPLVFELPGGAGQQPLRLVEPAPRLGHQAGVQIEPRIVGACLPVLGDEPLQVVRPLGPAER